MPACACHTHTRQIRPSGNASPRLYAVDSALRRDPTRTGSIQRAFIREIKRRFTALKRVIRESVATNDCFGLINPLQREITAMALSAIPHRAYEFKRSAEKVESFMTWLNQQEQLGILEISHRPGFRGLQEAWSDTYVHAAYQKGLVSARQKMKKAGYDVETFSPDNQVGIRGVMNQPMHADRLGALYTRTFTDLKGVTQAMDAQISRVLTQGIMEGRNPYKIARTLTETVDKIGINRANMIARTEVVRAHHLATIQEYRNWGIEEIDVMAEWVTAGFGVCPLCLDMAESGPYTLEEIEGEIPAHPNCRCTTVPIDADTAREQRERR